MLFAQLHLLDADFLKNAIILAVGALGLWSLIRRRKNEVSPQPLEVKMAEGLITKEACDTKHRDFDGRVAKIEDSIADADHKRAQIYERIENVRKELRADIQHVSDKVEVLPMKLLEMLQRNGGQPR